MSVKLIKAYKVGERVFTEKNDAEVYSAKEEIVETFKKLDVEFKKVGDITVDDLDTFTLESLRRIGRMADKALKLK